MADLNVDFTKEEQQEMIRDHERKRDMDMIKILEARGYIVKVRPEIYDINQRDVELITVLESRGYEVRKK
jgi:hypothetical protein